MYIGAGQGKFLRGEGGTQTLHWQRREFLAESVTKNLKACQSETQKESLLERG